MGRLGVKASTGGLESSIITFLQGLLQASDSANWQTLCALQISILIDIDSHSVKECYFRFQRQIVCDAPVTMSVYILAGRNVNARATAGQDVTLVCNATVKKPVNWWYDDQKDSEEREIVVNGELVNGNVYRMTLVGYNLIIHNVLPNDTGVYTCVEETGFGEYHKISLTVSGSYFGVY